MSTVVLAVVAGRVEDFVPAVLVVVVVLGVLVVVVVGTEGDAAVEGVVADAEGSPGRFDVVIPFVAVEVQLATVVIVIVLAKDLILVLAKDLAM